MLFCVSAFIGLIFPFYFLNFNLFFCCDAPHFSELEKKYCFNQITIMQQHRNVYLIPQSQSHQLSQYRQYNNLNMGVTQSNFSQTLQFVQVCKDPHFGQIQIFKSHQAKFIMKNNKSYITGDKRYHEFRKIIDFVQTKAHPNLIPILYIQQEHQSNVCIQYQKVFIYTQYFNFTLEGLITHKKQIDLAQIWYCMRSLLQLLNLLIQNNLKIQLSLNNVFLTLKGVPSIYLYHLIEQETIKTGENIIRESDIVQTRTMFYQLGKIILQLFCMQKIPEGEQDMETFFIQQLIQKASPKSMILVNLIKQLLCTKLGDEVLKKIQEFAKQKKIKISNEIRFNKFKYVIPDQKRQNKNLQIKIDSQNNIAKPTELINSFKTPLYKVQSNRTFSSQNIRQKAKTEYQQQNNNQEFKSKSKPFFNNPKIEAFNEEIISQKFIKLKQNNQNQNFSQPIAIKPRRKSSSIYSKSKQLTRTQEQKNQQRAVTQANNQKLETKNQKLLDRMKILNILKQKQDTFNISSSRNLDSSDFLSELDKKKIENQKKMMELNMRKQMMEKGFQKTKRQGFQSQDKQNRTTQINYQVSSKPSSNSLRQSHKINPKPISFLTTLKTSGKRVPTNLTHQLVNK